MDNTQRFKNQRIAQFIHRKKRKYGDKPYRIENCYRLKASRTHEVSLHLSSKPGSEKAHYHGLQTCGSVWACPICSTVISERRKIEFQKGIDTWRSKDPCNVVTMVTFTTPHHVFQSLSDVLDIQDKAILIMKKQPQRGSYKVWRTIMDELLSVGSYTGREVTFGENGWHPHRHECVFAVQLPVDSLQALRDEITHAFAIAFQKAGGTITDPIAFRQRAVTVSQINDDNGFDRITSYVTKVDGESWNLSCEVTKGISKLAKNGNITPFGMLDHIRQGGPLTELYVRKYREYVETMHGKQQFFPTHGLSAFLGVMHLTDAEIMDENERTGNHYANISDPQWQIIVQNELRAEILELTKGRNGFEFLDVIDDFLNEFLLQEVR